MNEKYIDTIALRLSEDVYGASGDLSEDEIFDRLIENIHMDTDYAYRDKGMPVHLVASLLKSMWRYMDENEKELLTEAVRGSSRPPFSEQPSA
jgi:hypothetical protein